MLRLNWDSRNLGPNVDMPAMRVASVAPARQSRMNTGFFRRSQMELDRAGGMETREKRQRVRVGQSQGEEAQLLRPWSFPPELTEAQPSSVRNRAGRQ